MDEQVVDTVEADEVWKQRIAEAWHETAAQHMHLEDGFSLVVVYDDEPIGLISVHWRQLPPPLSETHEGYIDIIRTLFLPLEGLDHWTERTPFASPGRPQNARA